MPPKSSYQKLDQRNHILIRPDSYIGSTRSVTEKLDIPVGTDKVEMQEKYITFVPGLLKIFDEILVNAIDHSVKDSTVKLISVTIGEDYVEVLNDGRGIPVEEIEVDEDKKKKKYWIPGMVFGELLSGSNFDDTQERFVGGRNGYGAKLTNIYSKSFILETVDSNSGKKYIQNWKDNMETSSKPKITSFKGKSYTKVKFFPDFSRFEGLTDTFDKYHISLFKRRVYDAAACTRNNIIVKLNGESLKFRDFPKYIDLFIGTKSESKRIHQFEKNEKGMEWDVIASPNKESDDSFKQVSFVNGISTYKGGKHVDYITNQIVKKLVDRIKSKNKSNKDLNVKPGYIKDRLSIFIRSTIVNPNFDSQSKEYLTTNVKDFGMEFKVSDKFIDDLAKSGIEKEIIDFAKFKENKEAAKKSDGKKVNKIFNIPKLDDANKAGTAESHKCTIIFTEGDSAAAFATAGLDVIGRDYYGVFPLKGKVLNVREATGDKASTNDEIKNIKQIIGLKQGKVYTNTRELRYGKVLLLADADVDGSHIKGLVMNMFHYWWPSLFNMPGFITSLATPIVKANKGNEKRTFYTLSEFNRFIESATGNWKTKYYKGLATSSAKEAKESFKNLETKLIKYTAGNTEPEKKKSSNAMELGFKKDLADERKDWILKYNKDNILEQNDKTPKYYEFINKDLIHFSVYDTQRSIPNVMDGLKPGQRKILFGCFKRNLTKDTIKVAQLSGYISENAAYHHGEESLNKTIVGMAQTFVGSNNINLLYPDGQFGTRKDNGNDAGSPRYIYTKLEKIASVLFNSLDFPSLNYTEDDGQTVEPEFYTPILPMVLVNGASGIGTGFSTDVPSYNPEDILKNITLLMSGKQQTEIIPWYRDFKGKIAKCKEAGKYTSIGNFKRLGDKKIEVTELPVGMSIVGFKKVLSKYILSLQKEEEKKGKAPKKQKDAIIESFDEKHKDGNIRFVLLFDSKETTDKMVKNNFELFKKTFNLAANINTTNMHLFDKDLKIKKYKTVNDIIKDFYNVRLDFYKKRYAFIKNKLEIELLKISAKVRFIREVIAEEITVFKKSRDYINKKLEKREYPKFAENENVKESFTYLTKMSIDNFTKEKIAELEALLNKSQEALDTLLGKTPVKLWKEDLLEFMTEYEKFNKGSSEEDQEENE